MGSSFARFRDLSGIGPTTEARLHAAGIHTWDALAVAATALAGVRGEGGTPRDVANAVAARRAEAREEDAPGDENNSVVGPDDAPAAEPVPDDPPAARPRRRRERPRLGPPSSDHLVVLDAGKAIGGGSRNIRLVVTDTRAADGEFGYRATLAARELGNGGNGAGWTTVGSRAGKGVAPGEVALAFPEVHLPPGVHRLELRMEVRLPAPTKRPPVLRLA